MIVSVKEFISSYRKAFGRGAQLPIAFSFSDEPQAEVRRGLRCTVGAFSLARKGRDVILEGDFVGCGGGQMYLGRAEMTDRVANFVSQVEHYKQSPEMVREAVAAIGIVPAKGKHFNLRRIDKIDSWDGIEGLLFLATPDMLSGLCAWAFYDRNEADTVSLRFGAGCTQALSYAIAENSLPNGYRCFVGMTDISARPLVHADELAFVIPVCRLASMLLTMRDTCLFNGEAWGRLKKRMNEDKLKQ